MSIQIEEKEVCQSIKMCYVPEKKENRGRPLVTINFISPQMKGKSIFNGEKKSWDWASHFLFFCFSSKIYRSRAVVYRRVVPTQSLQMVLMERRWRLLDVVVPCSANSLPDRLLLQGNWNSLKSREGKKHRESLRGIAWFAAVRVVAKHLALFLSHFCTKVTRFTSFFPFFAHIKQTGYHRPLDQFTYYGHCFI